MWEVASVNQAQPAQDNNVVIDDDDDNNAHDQARCQLRTWPEVSYSPTVET